LAKRANATRLASVQARYRPRSNFARAVLPVVGGLGFFALLALATWGIASVMSRNPDQVEDRLVGTVFEVGNTEFVANLIDDGGPLLFQGLIGDAADRSVVLNHTGDDPGEKWTVRYAFPADRDDTCKVRQVVGTARFTDCDGREVGYDDLARPERVRPIVAGSVISIDLRGAAADAGETVPGTTDTGTTDTGTTDTTGTTGAPTTSD
jgi:hypothetical protein